MVIITSKYGLTAPISQDVVSCVFLAPLIIYILLFSAELCAKLSLCEARLIASLAKQLHFFISEHSERLNSNRVRAESANTSSLFTLTFSLSARAWKPAATYNRVRVSRPQLDFAEIEHHFSHREKYHTPKAYITRAKHEYH